VKVLRIVAAFGVAAVLTGCGPSPAPQPTSTTLTDAQRAEQCAAAADDIVAAVGEVLGEYEQSGTSPTDPSPAPSATAAPSPSATAGDPLGDAVAAARQTREQLGCDPDEFDTGLKAGLAEIEPETAIATAIWRRLSASLLGELRQEPGDWVLDADADLREVVARAAEGTTIVLPPGTFPLEDTLVLLQGVTLRGAGRDATSIRSTASDAAVIVATASLVRLEDLTIELTGDQPASGLVAGPSASVAMTGVRMAGAVAASDGVGGAGVYLSAQGDEGSGRGTTLEVTDSIFERNAWAGVAVAGGHRVSIESATFAGNGDVGILFLDTASGSVAHSTFTDNRVGMAASGSAAPTWRADTITGGSVGPQMDAGAAPVIDGLQISGSASAAVIYGGRSAGSMTESVCSGVPYGIVVADTATPTLGANSCEISRGPS
jgi:hypothetical protein